MIIEKDGKKYLLIGDKAVPFDKVDSNGRPIIEVKTEETINQNGGKDVKVKVPSLKVAGKSKI